jgi:hypothetical protein
MPSRTALVPRVRRLMRREAARREAQDDPAVSPAPSAERAPPAAERRAEADRLEALEAEARHHHNRLALYRARMYAAKPTSVTRLRELEQAAVAADDRLAHARRAAFSSAGPPASGR